MSQKQELNVLGFRFAVDVDAKGRPSIALSDYLRAFAEFTERTRYTSDEIVRLDQAVRQVVDVVGVTSDE